MCSGMAAPASASSISWSGMLEHHRVLCLWDLVSGRDGGCRKTEAWRSEPIVQGLYIAYFCPSREDGRAFWRMSKRVLDARSVIPQVAC